MEKLNKQEIKERALKVAKLYKKIVDVSNEEKVLLLHINKVGYELVVINQSYGAQIIMRITNHYCLYRTNVIDNTFFTIKGALERWIKFIDALNALEREERNGSLC